MQFPSYGDSSQSSVASSSPLANGNGYLSNGFSTQYRPPNPRRAKLFNINFQYMRNGNRNGNVPIPPSPPYAVFPSFSDRARCGWFPTLYLTHLKLHFLISCLTFRLTHPNNGFNLTSHRQLEEHEIENHPEPQSVSSGPSPPYMPSAPMEEPYVRDLPV